MITLLKNYSYENILNKILLLFILNATDIVFTLILLNSGFCLEANPFMVNIVQSPLKSFIFKIILPAILLMYLTIRLKKANNHQLKVSNVLINIMTIFYLTINIFHLIWLSTLVFLVLL
ncbi:MAG: hypothetical protein FH751_12535 [Firmicutes bacterium]|nr:hypothetical protein [Bacillota bacterium]